MKKKELPSREEIFTAIQAGKKLINDLLVENVNTRFRVEEFFEDNTLSEIDGEIDKEVYEYSQHLEEIYSFLTGFYGHLIEMEVHYGREK